MKTAFQQHSFLSAVASSRFALALLLSVALLAVWDATPATAGEAKTEFVPSGTNEFAFDTGVLRGTLRAKGRSIGLSSVVHLPSGMTLDRSMGLFSHYRVFSANQRHGTSGWDWPSTAQLQPNGSVEVNWPAATNRPFELRAIYRWAAPNTLDVETIVTAQTKLAGFESFLASYFQSNFTNSLVYVQERPGQPGASGFMTAEKSAGVWQVFPRDAAAASLVQDGRWKFPPNPVDWAVMPRLAKPIGVRRDPASGLTAVLMSPPKDCFAISTPYQTEGHGSTYLSLFGRDLKPGEPARARARLTILSKPTDADILNACESYLRQCKN